MYLATLSQIKESIKQLPLDDKLRLLERVTRSVREEDAAKISLESQLAAMAADPEIQDELQRIDEGILR